MASYTQCRVRVTYDDGAEAFEDDDCDVSLEDGKLLITYWDERGVVLMTGIAEGASFEMIARSRPRRATLSLQGNVLEGTWQERDDTGGLRIELARG